MIQFKGGRLATAAAVVGVASLLIAGCGQQQATGKTSTAKTTSTAATTPAAQTVSYTWQVVNGGNSQHSTWPFFSQDGTNPFPATLTLPANATVTLTIENHDDGNGTVPASYAKVTGTVGNVETVSGKQVSSYNAQSGVSHTFTVAALGLNIPLPPAPSGSAPSTVQVTFHTPAKAGTYTWQCYVPCGTGSSGWGGPMVTPGWMMGSLKIL